LHACAEGCDGLRDSAQVLLAARLRRKLVPLSRHRLELALHRLAPALILLQRHHLIQIGVREAVHLALQAGLRAVELRAVELRAATTAHPAPARGPA
jgi:hypothetical protein